LRAQLESGACATEQLDHLAMQDRDDHLARRETGRDGRALRHGFGNRRTALAHRNGIRKAIGQTVGAP